MVKRKTHEQFAQEVYNLVGDEYEIIGDYTNAHAPIKMKHVCEKCNNYEYYPRPSSFLRGSRCPHCAGRPEKNTEIFKEEVFNLVGDEYIVLGDYVNNKTKLEVKHKTCECIYPVAPDKFLNGRRCPKCFGITKKDTLYFKQELFNLVENEYILISEYIRDDIHVIIKHSECQHEYKVTPSNFIKGTRCPKCSKRNSKGERKIVNFLDKSTIINKSQYWFEDCKDENVLRFDSAVFDNHNNLVFLIEFDGEGHFKPFRFSKNEDVMLKKLNDTQRRDVIKNKYCIDKRIPLIRIPEWEYFNIENILINAIYYFNLKEIRSQTFYSRELIEEYLVEVNWNQEEYISKYKRTHY